VLAQWPWELCCQGSILLGGSPKAIWSRGRGQRKSDSMTLTELASKGSSQTHSAARPGRGVRWLDLGLGLEKPSRSRHNMGPPLTRIGIGVGCNVSGWYSWAHPAKLCTAVRIIRPSRSLRDGVLKLGAASAVLRPVVSYLRKAKLSSDQSIYVPILIHGHEILGVERGHLRWFRLYREEVKSQSLLLMPDMYMPRSTDVLYMYF